jgi:hypothetical protein
MPVASRVLLAAALALFPVASTPFPVAAAQRHAPVAAAAAPATSAHPRASDLAGLAATPHGKLPSAPASRAAFLATSPRAAVTSPFVNDGGFETEFPTGSWTQVSSGTRQLVDTSHPHSGSYSADLCQNTDTCADVVYQEFTVPAKVISATFTFWFQVQTSDSTAQPAPCNDFMGAGVSDATFHVTSASAVKFCEDWGVVNGYTSGAIDETAYLQAHQGQLAHVEGVGFTDAAGPSRYWFDDVTLTITYATPPTQPPSILAEPNNSAVTLKWQPPTDNGGDPVSGYQVSVFKNGLAAAGTTFNSATTTEVIRSLSNGALFTFQVQAINGAGTSPLSALSNAVIPSPAYPSVAVSDRQYSLANNNGSTWVDMDPTYLSLSVTPLVNSQALISANTDLWTANAGINQDIGVAISGGIYPTAPGQPEAWKESGGSAGTFSPNAAYLQAVRPLLAGTTYTVKAQWKTNKLATGATIFAGAGPIGPDFSPTRLTVQLVPSAAVATASSVNQFILANSNGSMWTDLGPATDPTVPFTAPSNGSVVISANADLWTANSGFNQDLGITVSGGTGVGTTYPTTAGQPEAWKESGGFAGTQSPNAAFVQAVIPVVASSYSFKLQWKTNRQGSSTIVAGAGPIGGQYSATRLTVFFVPATGNISVKDAVTTGQPQLAANDGATWADMDSLKLSLPITTTSNCVALLSGNADLWTTRATYNQDIGIQVSATSPVTADRIGWKESGGFAGTYSPNAAFVQTMFPLAANTAYTARLQWKANKNAPAGTVIAGAGPIGTAFSPTRLTAIVYCVPPPVITSISPTSGYRGTPVTINGSGLTGATVNFGTQPAFVQAAGDTQMVVFPPTQPVGTVVDVTASTSGGTSPTVPADRFTYSYSGAILADSPNIYYRLGESAGTTARDSSGHGNNGAYSASGVTLGVASAIANDTDTAITLDGTNGFVQETSGAGVPTGFANRSIEAWFKTTSATDMPIVAYGTPGVANQYFGVYVNGTSIEVKTGAGTTITFPGSASLANGAWHHLVVTYDSGVIAGNLKVYIDGVNFGTQTSTTNLSTTLDAAGLEVGKDDTPAFFNGSLDEVAIYSTVLATYQISNHYKAGTGT